MDSITTYDLPYWVTCLSDELSAATFEGAGFAEKQLAYCKSYIEMHEGLSDKEIRNLGNLRNDLASAYCARGEIDIADALYEEWLGAEPEWGFGWIGWADHYSFGRWEAALKLRDLDKAERILNRGLAVRNVAYRDVMEERLETVQEENRGRRADGGHATRPRTEPSGPADHTDRSPPAAGECRSGASHTRANPGAAARRLCEPLHIAAVEPKPLRGGTTDRADVLWVYASIHA